MSIKKRFTRWGGATATAGILAAAVIAALGCGGKEAPRGDGGNTETSAIADSVVETTAVADSSKEDTAASAESNVEKIICNDFGEKGTFTDARDGQTYRTVVMPDCKTWMAQNLNYKADGSWCVFDDPDGAHYGRRYEHNAAVAACPAGWRLPSKADWEALIKAVEGEEEGTAGTKLKAKTGWNNYVNEDQGEEDGPESLIIEGLIIGTDDFGFSALPGGMSSEGNIQGTDSYGYFWSATKMDYHSIYGLQISFDYEYVSWFTSGNGGGLSVRCVRE